MDLFVQQKLIQSENINQPFEKANQMLYKLKEKYGFSSLIVITNLGVSALSLLLLILTIKY
jgi:hypothetical protein